MCDQFCYSIRNRSEILSDKDTGLDSETHYHNHNSLTDQPSTITDSCFGEQDTMVTSQQQQQAEDTDNIQQHTLSQNTSVGATSSDEIEEFEDDNIWRHH